MTEGIIKENLFVGSTAATVFTDLPAISDISSLLSFTSEKYADKTAIVDGKNYTYSELASRAGQYRSALKAAGVPRGGAVGICFPNSFEFAAAALGAMSYGAIAVMIPFALDGKTVFGCSMKYGFNALIYDASAVEKVKFTAEMNKNVALICPDNLSDGYEPVQTVCPSDGAAVVFTAGTTGKSKGALLSHKALSVGMLNGCYGWGDALGQRYFLLLPLTHIFGLVRNLLTSIYTGSSLYICRDLKNMFRELPVYKPTIMVMVPALAEMALNMTRMISPAILGGELKTIICGAAVVSPYLAREYDRLGVKLSAGYGMTETANLVSGNPNTVENPESVGFMYPDQSYKIVDGELWLKGDHILTEYYKDPEETEKAFSDGYFKTGDLVRVDSDGYLYITGRCKDIIVLSTGENVSPAELETRFCELDCVQDALVYLSRAESGAESLVLEVLPRTAELKKAGIDDVAAYCNEKIKEVNGSLYAYQRVNRVIIRTEDFPRTPSMKIIRPKNI